MDLGGNDPLTIDKYVESLKDAYTRLRRRWRPDYRGPSSSDHEKWHAAARSLSELKLDPYAYIRFVFDQMTPMHPDVYVNMATSPKMIQVFISEQHRLREDATRLAALQSDQLKHKLQNGWDLRRILTDPYSEFTPLFAFAVAWSEGLRDIAASLREEAEKELLFQPVYKELLAEWLPAEMR